MQAGRRTGLAVGFDIGGTKLAAGLVGADGSVITRARERTPADDPAAISDLVERLYKQLCAEHGVSELACGVGAPGAIDRDGVVRYAPNIAYRQYPLRADLSERLGVPVTVDNDANVAAWGEYRAGAGRGEGGGFGRSVEGTSRRGEAAVGGRGSHRADDGLLMLTIGTGVGGGLVMGDRLVRGAHGMAAEFGHVIVAEGGPPCPCGNRGCLESVASGTAIGRLATEAVAAGRVPQGSLLRDAGELTGKRVTVAAHAGDEAAVAILAEVGTWLGVGIASLVNALDPELVVIGGGAVQAGELVLDPARAALAERIFGGSHRPLVPVVRAQLADDAGIVGAALLALAAD